MKEILLIIVACATLNARAANINDSPKDLIIEGIQCEGNLSTDCSFIKSQVFLNIGDKMDEEEVSNVKLRLSTISNFKSTNIFLKKGGDERHVILVIQVEEKSPYLSEFHAGTSISTSSITERVGGRIAHQNLFGKGEVLDLEIDGSTTITNDISDSFYSRVQYIDPHLFESKKYFFITGLTYELSKFNFEDGDFYKSEKSGVDAIIGRRVGDFSYYSLGFQYNPTYSVTRRFTRSDGKVELEQESFSRSLLFNYGWNTEDDPYFPTIGSRFGANMVWSFSEKQEGARVFRVDWGFRVNWTTKDETTWSLLWGGSPDTHFRPSLEEDLGLSLAYARPLKVSPSYQGIKRGRWYIQPGFQSFGYSSSSGFIIDPGIKAGIRIETEAFGVVDIYAIGCSEWRSK